MKPAPPVTRMRRSLVAMVDKKGAVSLPADARRDNPEVGPLQTRGGVGIRKGQKTLPGARLSNASIDRGTPLLQLLDKHAQARRDTARRLKALLEARLGLRVILTREDDRTLDQDQRAAIANNNRADLFVSVHANAAVRPTVKGAEVYYLSVDRASLESRRAIQQPDALPQLGGGTRAIELILWETAQLRHLECELAQGFYFSHPDSGYFAVGKVGRDQVEDYARRKGMALEEAERWLAPYLAYEPGAIKVAA